jgi:type IV secretion system protein VirD4
MNTATRTTTRRPLPGAVLHIHTLTRRVWTLWCTVCMLAVRTAVIMSALVVGLTRRPPVWLAALGIAVVIIISRVQVRRQRCRGGLSHGDALTGVRYDCAAGGGGAFIGVDELGAGVFHAPAECAVLVLGPPRRGKTSTVIIPSVLAAPGAVLTTSTKPDVLVATARARSRFGHVWFYDPSGQSHDLPAGVRQLRWSPLEAAGTWESARRLATAMVGASPAAKGTRGESHWTSRAAALLAPLLYAATLDRDPDGRSMRAVVAQVLTHDADAATGLLEVEAGLNVDAAIARDVLTGVTLAAKEERQSIWSAAADVIDVYATREALDAAADPNFDPADFVRSGDTVYIASSAAHQAACAPLVVALIEAIRDAQYARHRDDALTGRQTWPPTTVVLDEVCNVAPIQSLPALVSEAGGQGLHVVAAVQDLSQVRARWGVDVAEGFLSLFQHVLVLGGIRDTKTLDTISLICGEWLRPTISTSVSTSHGHKRLDLGSRLHAELGTNFSTSTSEVRERLVPQGEVYGLAAGRAIYLHGSGWSYVQLAAHYSHPRWTAALAAAPAHIQTWEHPDDTRLQVPAGLMQTVRAAHPVFANGQPLSAHEHASHENGQGLSTNGHRLSGNGHDVLGNGQGLSGNGHRLSDDDQSPGQGVG